MNESVVFSVMILIFPILLMMFLGVFIVIRGIRRNKAEVTSNMQFHTEYEIIEPTFNIVLEGFTYMGRGPNPYNSMDGWIMGEEIFFRCAKCGSIVKSTTLRQEDYACECGALRSDCDWGRLGSNYGDKNILVYEKK